MTDLFTYITPLNAQERSACAEELFGKALIPALDYSLDDMEGLAAEWLATQATVTGVQPKLSLRWQNEAGTPPRLTIIGALQGDYILKSPYDKYPQMPELEALCMTMARACGIATVPFGLMPLKSAELCYLTKRIDRNGPSKVAMEDMCQLTQRLTEDKYKGSHEQVARLIAAHSSRPLFDLVRYYEVVLFSFLIGNNDMHLKNFSLFAPEQRYILSPAYDLISSQLLVPDDDEDLALNLNGKKKKLLKKDFDQAMERHFSTRAMQNLYDRIEQGARTWGALIEHSTIDRNIKERFRELIQEKTERLGLKPLH